jgi:uncharacterized protein DUF1616
MRRDNTDLAVTATVTVAAAMVLLLSGLTAGGGPGITVLGTLAGLPLVLVLPGYALSTLIVPRPPSHIGPLLWRASWIAGLSLAVTVLGGLVLNLMPAGLTRTTWTTSLTAMTLLALAASAWLRGYRFAQDPSTPRIADKGTRGPRTPSGGGSWPTGSLVGYAAAALAISTAAMGVAIASAGWQHSPGFAQLWLVPAASGEAGLGVRSAYSGAETFRLVLRGDPNAHLSWDFTLGSGQTWQRTISAPVGQHLTAQLTVTGQSAAETVSING